jgi:hypothetical protein
MPLRRLRSLAILPLLLAAAGPAAASAAPPWSPPQPIPGSDDAFPRLAFTGNGQAAATWTGGGGGFPLVTPGARFAAGRFEPTRPLADGARLDLLGGYGRDRLLGAGTRGDREPRAVVAFGRPAEAFSRARDVGPRGVISRVVALDVNRRGDAAVLLTVREASGGPRTGVPYLVVRRAGGSFGRPQRVATGGPTFAGAVAVNPRGDVLVAWARPVRGTTGERFVLARIRRAGGPLGAARRLGRATTVPQISAALGEGRRAVVTWIAQPVSEGVTNQPAIVQAAAAPAGERFGPAQRLEQVGVTGAGRYVGQAGARAAIAPDGRGIVAWTGYSGARFVVRAASVEGTRVGEGQVVSDPAQETVLSDLATGPRGDAVVLGLQGLRGADPTGPVSVVAAARAPGAAAFGAREVLDGPAQYFEAARAAFDPVTGRALAVWRDLGRDAVTWAVREPVAGP